MGQIGIRSTLGRSMLPGLRKALESQLKEYDSIETEAHTLATQHGWELSEVDPAIRVLTDMTVRMKLNGKNTDSKIAGMMIQGNTRGLINGLKNIHDSIDLDDSIRILSQKLMDCENANIRKMQTFL